MLMHDSNMAKLRSFKTFAMLRVYIDPIVHTVYAVCSSVDGFTLLV